MECKSCKKKISKGWKFCPFCGQRIRRGFKLKFPDFGFPKERSPEAGIEHISKQMENMLKAFGFPGKINIQVRTLGGDQFKPVAIDRRKVKVKGERETTQTLPKVEEMLEPIAKETRLSNGIKYVLSLPGVKYSKDIIIKQFSESLEIRAYAGKRGYFKVIPIPSNHKIVEKKFQNEFLKIIIARV